MILFNCIVHSVFCWILLSQVSYKDPVHLFIYKYKYISCQCRSKYDKENEDL